MQNLLLYVYTSLPFVVVALLCVLAIVAAGIGMVRPRWLAYAYMLVFFLKNSTNYGSLATMGSPGIYTRGSGVLLFPVLFWMMFGFWACARVSASLTPENRPTAMWAPSSRNQARNQGRRLHGGLGWRWKLAETRAQAQKPNIIQNSTGNSSTPEPRV